MNVTREDLPGRQVALTIDLDADTINTALDHAYRQMVNQVDIPGFRRGRAPRYMLERYVGTEMLTERAVKNILPQALQDAIAGQNIEALDVGEVEIVNMDPVQVKVVIVQPPKIELGDYGAIRVEKEPVEVTPEQIDQVMTELRREGAPWNEPAEPRPAREGDMVYLNLEGFTNEGPLEEAQRENFPTIVGMERGGGVPEIINKALEGMSVGGEKDLTDTLPEDYPIESLRGRDVTYHLTLNSLKEQELPELNDEFAKTVGFDAVDALREAVERNLRRRAEELAESKQLNSAIEQLVQGSTAEVPDVLVNEELDAMLKRLESRLKEQRINLRQYFTFNGVTENEWREANRERARERVVNSQVLQEFARREGIEVEENEVDNEIQTMLDRFEGQEKEQAQSVLTRDKARHDLEDRLYQRKVLDRLIGIYEGKVVAAPAPAEEGAEQPSEPIAEEGAAAESSEPAPKKSRAKAAAQAEGANEAAQSNASDLEAAGGAAELLGTDNVDLRSPNETGEAAGGGTPESAPGLEGESES